MEELNIQNEGSEVLQDKEFEGSEALQDKEFEALLEYDSTEDFPDIDNWDHVSNFMKKYTATKDHGMRIGGAKSNRTALMEKQHSNTFLYRIGCLWKHTGHELHPLAVRFVSTLCKLPEEFIEEIHFLTVVAKANATIQYRVIREKFNMRII
ncbi:11617_t:CDS:2 [Funneliformis mosseae]|uniref:11617_t:CDS:1 n=1 Tax=Funneliformis mosseae TaxID=27381 RepID=A0A9N9HK40_FUNMO|nr:11617_t:CDS:2 [Funneliformis mosseae]